MSRSGKIGKQISEFISRTADRAGYCFVPQWRLKERQMGWLLANLFKRLDVDCVLDVGANRGQFRSFLRTEARFRGPILSFEPISQLAEWCRNGAVSDRDWQIFQIALGKEDSRSKINVTQSDDLSSFLTPIGASTGRQLFGEDILIRRTEEVSVRRLDTLLPELMRQYGFSRPYLKLDTQGFDLTIIEGADSVLHIIPALQTELSVIPLYDNAPHWLKVIQHLGERSFAVSGMFPVNYDRQGCVIEFDGVFVRR